MIDDLAPSDIFLDLVQLQMVDGHSLRAEFERDAEHALVVRHALGIQRDQEPREGVQCSQTRIACGDAILPFGFQMAEEPCDPFRGEIIQFERFDPSPGVLCRVAQEKENSIAVTAEGMEAQPTLVRQVFLKEAVQGTGQTGR